MVLKIPDAGLLLESSPKTAASLPMQAFAVTLSDGAIEDMIECVRSGGDISLSLGNSPTFIFGDSSYRLPRTPDPISYDLFLTDPRESPRTADRLPNPTVSLFKKPDLNSAWAKKAMASEAARREGRASPSPKAASGSTETAASELDADITALKSSFAQAKAEKLGNQTKVIEGPPPSTKQRGAAKPGKKVLAAKASAMAMATQSMPSSPALSGVGSPSLTPSLSASQQVVEKAKQARSPIIHELAFREQTYDNLWQKYPGSSEPEFKTALEKVAELDRDSPNYVLKKMYWKELDVWKHEYASGEERQHAIENAIKQYDRMRLTASEPEWQKLLPREERGKGKCLSKMQANIQANMEKRAPAAPTPKIKVQKAEESSADSGSSKDDGDGKKAAKGGEPMVRSSSQPQPKAKKPKEPAPEKRWLSQKKASTPKVSPTKPSAKAVANDKTTKFKSKEFISDSDSSDGASAAPSASIVPQPKPVRRPAEKKTAKEMAAPKAKIIAKEPIRSQITAKPAPKRGRDDDDSSSSSGTPLSKRFKVKAAAPPVQLLKHRPSDASQNSRGTSSGVSYAKSKNTSPAKSSPLASSPPTNASDQDPAEENAYIRSKKRRLDDSSDSQTKRQRLSQDVVNKALKFKLYYEKYETLHKEMIGLVSPPQEKMADLWEMRGRLQTMKTEIYREITIES